LEKIDAFAQPFVTCYKVQIEGLEGRIEESM